MKGSGDAMGKDGLLAKGRMFDTAWTVSAPAPAPAAVSAPAVGSSGVKSEPEANSAAAVPVKAVAVPPAKIAIELIAQAIAGMKELHDDATLRMIKAVQCSADEAYNLTVLQNPQMFVPSAGGSRSVPVDAVKTPTFITRNEEKESVVVYVRALNKVAVAAPPGVVLPPDLGPVTSLILSTSANDLDGQALVQDDTGAGFLLRQGQSLYGTIHSPGPFGTLSIVYSILRLRGRDGVFSGG